jgi:glycosyltransferase involved in cell wall biosynthesis
MNLLFISLMSGDRWGGSEELWYRIAKHALQQGDEVSLSVKSWPELHPKILELSDNGCIVHRRIQQQVKSTKSIIKKLFKIAHINPWFYIKDNQFDHILINFGGAYDILWQQELIDTINSQNTPYSIIQQFNYENTYLNHYDRKRAREFFTKAKNVFFVSHRNKRTTQRNLACALPNAHITSNPANIEILHPGIKFPNGDTLKFACVARFDVDIKNQDFLIEAFSGKVWTNRDFQLNLYGNGEGELYLRELIEAYGLEQKVFIRGHVNNVHEIWRENHVMILPSSAEGSPLSIVEAMYCGRPVIATNVAGNKELLDETCGFIISGVNIEEVEATLENVWLKREYLKQMGESARKRIERIHDVNSYITVYDIIKN